MTITVREAEEHELHENPEFEGKVLVFAGPNNHYTPALVLDWPEWAEFCAEVARFNTQQLQVPGG